MSLPICNREEAAGQLMQIAQVLSAKGWLPATSGNLSVLMQKEPLLMAVTASGVDKEFLRQDDIVVVDQDCQVVGGTTHRKPSYETQIHRLIYDLTDAGAVLHVHTVFNNLVGVYAKDGWLKLRSIELIKAFGVWEEDAEIVIPVVDNFADIAELTQHAANRLKLGKLLVPGLLLRTHGIYVWGKTWQEAKKHLQAFEFLFEYLVHAGGELPNPVTRE
ncbi:MAG: methylthioribulose 1-phosphate dehydratase [Bacilli bacterium]|nr:methylthioribulose 1-phosphate dehydratase [Bacilli bacterium]